jgi:hypothetical protein
MSRTESRSGHPGRPESLLVSGDHGAAALAARSILADAGSPAEERARAGAVLASLSPEPLALVLGGLGVALAVALALWVALGGAR